MPSYLSARANLFVVLLLTAVYGRHVSATELSKAQAERMEEIIEVADPSEFLEAVHDFWKKERHDLDSNVKASVHSAFASRARVLLLEPNTRSAVDSATLRGLQSWANDALSAREKNSLLAPVRGDIAKADSLTFNELELAIMSLGTMLPNDFSTKSEIRAATAAWVNEHDLSALSKQQLDFCFRSVCPEINDKDGFRVTWTGFLTVPVTGEYKFSTCPWKISYSHEELGISRAYAQSFIAQVNGRPVVDAQGEAWVPEGAAISLQAGTSVPIHVEFKFDRNEDHRLCAAVLYWEGPGFERMVVPASVLSVRKGGQRGLQAHYTWSEDLGQGNSEDASHEAIEPNIEILWHRGLNLDARDTAAQRIRNEYLRRWVGQPLSMVDDLARQPQLLSLLSISHQGDMLEQLRAEPESLRTVGSARMLRFYDVVRCGADRSAIDTLGTWMTGRRDARPVIAGDGSGYFMLNRMFYYTLTRYLAFENPPAMEWLKDGYLETDDGYCCLPVAYAVTECQLLRGELDSWIEEVEAHLADTSLTGDARVNWLIARAHAESVRGGIADRHAWNSADLSAGNDWLIEAREAAQSETSRFQVDRETVARMAAWGSLEDAADFLNTIASTYSSNSIQQEIKDCLLRLEALVTEQRVNDTSRRDE